MSDAGGGNRDDTSDANRIDGGDSERRRYARFPLTASVEAIEPQSHAKITGRISDLGLGGCYVDTISPFGVGTVIRIRLTKEKLTFEADAKVIFAHVGMGMGVAFVSPMPQQHQFFQKWLSELAGEALVKQDAPRESEAKAVITTSAKNQALVLGEIVVVLIRKGMLSEVEGKAMLQKLHR